jgi:nucleoid-associated protein YgaU
MKRISIILAVALWAVPVGSPAQDAAVEERLNQLSAKIQDLIDARDAQSRRIDELAKRLRELQDEQGKPGAGYATQTELKQLAAKLQEVDEKRQQDSEHVARELEKLGKTLGSASPRRPVAPTPVVTPGDSPAVPDKGYEYVIQSGDNLSAIAKAYNDKGFKVTVDQILKANPGLKPKELRVGQKIFIPAP